MSKHEKILDRIRKLLSMAGDTSSPNEAAIAAARARKMMDEYQVNELDLTSVADDDLGTNSTGSGQRTVNKPLNVMSCAVADLNDVRIDMNRGPGGEILFIFKGFLVDAVCATEMFKYLSVEMYRQAERNAWGRSNRFAYRLGFASGIRAQIDEALKERREIKTAAGTSLMVVKDQLVVAKYGVAKYRNVRTSFQGSHRSYDQGKERGRNTNLDRQVGGKGQTRIGGAA